MVDLSQLSVCFIAGSLGQGGAERQLYYMLRALKAEGTRLHVLCLSQGEFWEAPIRALGVPVTWVGASASKLGRLGRIVQWVRREQPDIVQSQLFYTNLYATAAARFAGAYEIGAIRNNLTSELGQGGRLLGYLSLHLPRFLAANSRLAIRNAQAAGVSAARLHFLANVVDTEYFTPPLQASQEGPFRILTVGRLVRQKRLDRFIDVLATLRQQSRCEVRGIIVGGERRDRTLRLALEKQGRESGVFPGVLEFRGEVADMRSVYQEADCLLLTSDWEGTPNVVLEAMAAGLPVIGTRVGGVPDLVEDGTSGYLVDHVDKKGLVAHLKALAEDRSVGERLGKQARQFVHVNHALHRLPQSLESLYSVVIS